MAYLEKEQHAILVNGGNLDPDAVSAIQDDWSEHPDRRLGQREVTIPDEDFHRTVVIGLVFEDPHRFTDQGTVFFSEATVTYLQGLGLPVSKIVQNQSGHESLNETQTDGFINQP